MSTEQRQTTKQHTCEDCGEPATRRTIDGVWLCEGDWLHLLEQAEGIPDAD